LKLIYLCCIVYDVLSGETVAELDGHAATVRDVSWHPSLPSIVSTSVRKTKCLYTAEPDSTNFLLVVGRIGEGMDRSGT